MLFSNSVIKDLGFVQFEAWVGTYIVASARLSGRNYLAKLENAIGWILTARELWIPVACFRTAWSRNCASRPVAMALREVPRACLVTLADTEHACWFTFSGLIAVIIWKRVLHSGQGCVVCVHWHFSIWFPRISVHVRILPAIRLALLSYSKAYSDVLVLMLSFDVMSYSDCSKS